MKLGESVTLARKHPRFLRAASRLARVGAVGDSQPQWSALGHVCLDMIF